MWVLLNVEVRLCEGAECLSSPDDPKLNPNMDFRRPLSERLEEGRGIGAEEWPEGASGACSTGLERVIRRPKSLSLPNLPLRECLLDLMSVETEGVDLCPY